MRVVVCQFEGIDHTPSLPLAAGCVLAAARAHPELADLDTALVIDRLPLDRLAELVGEADVVGVSLYPWNAAYGLAAAAALRRALPGAWIVAGGPSVPRRPDLAERLLTEHPALDVLVSDEGERAFQALVLCRHRGEDPSTVDGVTVRRGERVRHRPPVRQLALDRWPSPYLDGTFDALFASHGDRLVQGLVETNRGCPFTCSFCDWSLTRQVVERPLETVLAELDWLVERGFSSLAITDANFGIRPRDAAIARHLADLRRRTGRPRYCYFYLTKNDHRRNLSTLETLHEAGIACSVGLAVQDFDGDVLEAVGRDGQQSCETERLRDICGERGLPTHNELILGLPEQTFERFTTTLARAMPTWPRHSFQVFLCRILPNTALALERAALGLVTRRCVWKTPRPAWDAVVDEVQELVVGTRTLPPADWARTVRVLNLASLAYNKGLLRAVLHHAVEVLGADRRALLVALADATETAAAGTALGRLGATVDRTLDSIDRGGPWLLPSPELGGARELDDLLALEAWRDLPALFAEVQAVFARVLAVPSAVLDEAFAVQALITPRPGLAELLQLGVTHDWATFLARGGTGEPLRRRHTELRFEPPTYCRLTDHGVFVGTHLACRLAGQETGRVVWGPGSPGGSRARARKSLTSQRNV